MFGCARRDPDWAYSHHVISLISRAVAKAPSGWELSQTAGPIPDRSRPRIDR